jgi:hypothetical protein
MKTIIYINFILTLLIIGFLGWYVIFEKVQSEEIIPTPSPTLSSATLSPTTILPSVLPTPKETVKIITITPAPSTNRSQTTYIPITGPITSTSTDWYDAPGTDFYLNMGDYGKNAYATWEASLKVAHGNGSAYARLYDVTNKIAVNGSEVLVTNNSNLTLGYSGSLNFWANNNLYRVQLKSLNSFEITFGGGRLKIVY